MIYGESGFTPITIDIKERLVSYWSITQQMTASS